MEEEGALLMTRVAAVHTLSTKGIPIMSIWKRQVIHRLVVVVDKLGAAFGFVSILHGGAPTGGPLGTMR